MAGISIQFNQHDRSYMKIWVTATNNRFSGESIVYIDEDGQELITLGNRLKGFPKQVDDVEEIEFGIKEFDLGEAGESVAYLGLKFYCVYDFGHCGHLGVHVTIEDVDSWHERPESSDKASFEMGLEPAQIDQFVEEVIKLGKTHQGTATLECRPSLWAHWELPG